MQKLSSFHQQIKHFKVLFDARTYKSFLAVIEGMLKLKGWKQADLAFVTGRTLKQIQYFFSKAVWASKELNEFRLRFLRNKPDFRDRKSDFAVADGSVLQKDKDASFSFLTEKVFSNLEKRTVNGLKLFGASIHTKHGVKYVLDFLLYFKTKWRSEWEAWQYFLTLVAEKTNAFLFVFDCGFRNMYLLSHAYHNLKRLFLLRIMPSQQIFVFSKKLKKKKRKKVPKYTIPDRIAVRIDSLLHEKSAIQLENGKLRILSEVIVKSWIVAFREEVSVIVFHRNGFKNPLVLCVSQAKVSKEEAMKYLETYFRRWGIEQLFKELKSWFCFEKFKVTSLEAIEKYLTIIVFLHSLLSQAKEEIEHIPKLKEAIQTFLKKWRNIIEFTLIGLKIFFEKLFISPTSFKSFSPHLDANFLTFHS